MKSKKIILISPEQNFPTTWEMYPSGALLTLGSMWKEKGHEVVLIHIIADGVTERRLENLLYAWSPDIVGITCTTFQVKGMKRIAKQVKQHFRSTKVVVGGPHPTLLGQELLDEVPEIDKVVSGEAENASLEDFLTTAREVLTYPPLEDMDSLPMPNMSLINLRNFKGAIPPGPLPAMFIMGSRGCPYDCTFCSKCFNRKVRHKSVSRVIEEIKWLRDKIGVKEVFFQDDTMNLKVDWLTQLFERIISEGLNNIQYRAPFRVNERLTPPTLLSLAKKAGVWLIFYGVESGSQEMLLDMQKGIIVEEAIRAFKITHKAGIKTEASFIIGLPGENGLTIMKSYDLWKRLRPFWVGFSRAIPFPGSEFSLQVRKNQHLLDLPYEEYGPDKMMVRTHAMSVEALESAYQQVNKKVRQNKLLNLIKNPRIGWKMYKREMYK